MHGLNGNKEQQKVVNGKHSIQKASGGSQFIGNGA